MLHNTLFLWKRPLWCSFKPVQLGPGAHHAQSQKRQTEHTALTGPQPEPFSLFIHTAVCLLKEKWQLSSSSKRKQKSQQALTGTERGLSQNGRSPNWRWQTQCCLHLRGKASAVVHKARHTRLEAEQVLSGLGFRWRDWEMQGRGLQGLCHRSRQCVVTRLSNRERHFFSGCKQTSPSNFKIKHYSNDVSLKKCHFMWMLKWDDEQTHSLTWSWGTMVLFSNI